MAAPVDPHSFVDALAPVVWQCARASRIFYGSIADIGKPADASLTGAQAQDASAAFTALDSGLQDILLSVVLQRFPAAGCIAEEATPLRRRCGGPQADDTVILDPIDGTLHFRNGDGPYHISIGLAHRGEMVAAVVARPTEDKVFTAIRGEGAWVTGADGTARRLQLPPVARTRAAFISSKARAYQPLAAPEFEPREHPIGAALILTQMAEGALCAYLTRQVEVYDVGPPSLIATEAGAMVFLRGGRQPRFAARRKFALFMAAADVRAAAKLRAMVRTLARGDTQ